MNNSFSKEDRVFIGAIALMHLVFFLLACCYTRIYMGDSYEYIYEALSIKESFFFYSGNPVLPISPEYMTQRQPAYPLFLMLVYLFTINNWVVIVLQNFISVATIYQCRKMLVSLGFDKKYDWLLLLLLVACPSQFINANTVAPDILLQLCCVLYFVNFVKLVQQRSLAHAAYMSCWLILGLFVKPVLYPFVFVHLLLLPVLFAVWKIKLQRVVVIAIVPLLAVGLYNYSNLQRTGKFHFSSNQAFNAIYYYYPFMSAKYGIDSANKFLQTERAIVNEIPSYAERYDYANQRGLSILKENFASYLAFHLKCSAKIFFDPGKAEMDLFTGKLTYGKLFSKKEEGFAATWKNKGLSGMGEYFARNRSMGFVLLVLLFNCVRAGGLLFFITDKKMNGWVRLFSVIFIVYFAVAAGPIANSRYFIPVSLIAIGCSTMGYVSLLNRRRASTL